MAPSQTPADPSLERRIYLDNNSRFIVLAFLLSAIFWLLFGSALGLIASLKMHLPDFLASSSVLSFGRIRPLHLNTMVYGWASLGSAGVGLWVLARVLRTNIPGRPLIFLGIIVWNLAVLAGSIAILAGYSRGLEWLELPLFAYLPIGLMMFFVGSTAITMLLNRQTKHLYISAWYVVAGFMWFPLLGIFSSLPIYHGTVEAGMNWWYAHNALGLWFTPIGLAAAYFFIPKVTGRPIYSYPLSMLGFWTLALFYNWNGFHHLIGGPVPTWFVTISISASVMMIIPVVTVAVNHHMTTLGAFSALKYSPTLQFIVFGAMSYTFVSLQGSFQALRHFNEVVHFTHYVVGHAHIGMYAFVTMVLFGSMYYIMPRLVNWEWHSPFLIKTHFALTALGIIIYVVAMQVGGILQGFGLNNPDIPFIDTVNMTRPFLLGRSLSAILLTLGHFVFAYLVWRIYVRSGERPSMPMTWLQLQSRSKN